MTQFTYLVSQPFPFLIGHVAKRPPIVCDMPNNVQYIGNYTFKQ